MGKLRIIQWCTGEIARHQVRLVASHPSMDLVGAFAYHDDKVGLDAGDIAGIGPLGVHATNDVEAMLALADCVLHNPPSERYDEIIPLLASGKNVISIMAGFHPRMTAPDPPRDHRTRRVHVRMGDRDQGRERHSLCLRGDARRPVTPRPSTRPHAGQVNPNHYIRP